MKKSIRDIKNGLQNFADMPRIPKKRRLPDQSEIADEKLTKKERALKKCAIINEQLCGIYKNYEHYDYEKPPRELIQFLRKVEIDFSNNDIVLNICSHLINVLEYLMDDTGRIEAPSQGLAVRKPAEALKILITKENPFNNDNSYNLRFMYEKLFDAARSRDVKDVKALVDMGLDINEPSSKSTRDGFCKGDGLTAVGIAAGTRDNLGLEIVKYLIDEGADVNFQDCEGETALMNAAYKNNALVVKALIEAGADVNAVDEDGDTALINAVKNDNREEDKTMATVKALIEAGANTEAVNDDGQTALDIAVYKHKSGVVKCLLSTEGAGSLREITYDQFEDFWVDCEKETTEYWGRPVIKKLSFPWKYEIVVVFNRVAHDIISDVLMYIKRMFKEKFGYEPKHVTYDNATRTASIYTI